MCPVCEAGPSHETGSVVSPRSVFPCVRPAHIKSPVHLSKIQRPLKMRTRFLQPRAFSEVTEDRDVSGSLGENIGRKGE